MRAVVFDLDGTLIDSAPDLHAAAIATLREAGLPDISEAQTRSFIGNGVPVLVARILAALEVPADADGHAQLTRAFLRHYAREPAVRTTLYPGVATALDRLAAEGIAMGLCTNKPEGPAREILAAMALDGRIGVVVGGDTLAAKKPDPAPLHRTLRLMGADRGLFVGDSEVDAATAQAAGLPFALYSGGYRKNPVTEIPHAILFDHFDALRLPAGLAA